MRSTLEARVQFLQYKHKSSYSTYAYQFFISSFKLTTSIHHTSMDIEIYNLSHASKHMKCTFKYTNQVYELAPPTCVLKILIDPLLCHISPPLLYFLLNSPLCYLFTIFVHYFSPFVINDLKGLILNRQRLSISINGVRIIFPNLVQSRSFAKDI